MFFKIQRDEDEGIIEMIINSNLIESVRRSDYSINIWAGDSIILSHTFTTSEKCQNVYDQIWNILKEIK